MSVSSGTMSVGVMAIFSGLLGAYGLRAMLLADPEPPKPPEPTITVPLATADLPEGRTIALADIALHQMTRKQMTEKGFSNSAVMLGTGFIVGRTVEVAIKKDQPFLTTSLYLEGMNPNVAEMLRPGERAVSIEVEELHGGNLAPNTTVDVVFRSEAREPTDRLPGIPEATVTLFEGVRVVASQKRKGAVLQSNNLDLRRTNGNFYVPPKPPIVTLAVSAEQAGILHTVQGRGELSLIPVGMEKDVPTVASRTGELSNQLTLESLLQVKPLQRPFAAEIYRGGSRQVRVYDDPLSELLPSDDASAPAPAASAPAATSPAATSPAATSPQVTTPTAALRGASDIQ